MFCLSGGYAVFSGIKISKLINESNKVKITCFISSKTYLSTYVLSTVLGFGNTKVDTVYILKKLQTSPGKKTKTHVKQSYFHKIEMQRIQEQRGEGIHPFLWEGKGETVLEIDKVSLKNYYDYSQGKNTGKRV